MRVQATKTMAQAINKAFKSDEQFKGYLAIVDRLFDFFEGDKQVIKIIYPYDYYAMPQYIDDKELTRIFKLSDKTYNGFFKTLLEQVEI